MATGLSSSARRVQEYLRERGYDLEVRELPGSTRTAVEAAQTIGCSVAEIAKSLVFREKRSGNPVLIIVSGANRVDLKKVEKAMGWKLGRADGNWVKERVGFGIGGIPPVAHLEPLATVLDPDLRKFPMIHAAAGTPFAMFGLDPQALESLTGGRWVELAERGDCAS